jgi:hypothetical protein
MYDSAMARREQTKPLNAQHLARYRENVAWRQQTVALFVDRVDVHRSISLADEADWRCSLQLLAPQFQTGRRRDETFSIGLVLLSIWFTVVLVLWQVSSLKLDSPKAAFFWALPVLSVALMLLGISKRPYVVVHSADGAPLFTIVKNYPDAKHFASFTELLLTKIREAHGGVASPALAEEPESSPVLN